MIQMTSTNGVHHEADEAIDSLYAWMPGTAPAPQPYPEALFSLTLRGTLDGIETLLTVRGMTPAEFQQNLASVRGLLDPKPQPPAQVHGNSHTPQAADTTPHCPTHGVLKPSTKGQGWYCPHKTAEGSWCPSKSK